jgi:1,4-dihydroxy-2-naphthoate octaprenyltransferase
VTFDEAPNGQVAVATSRKPPQVSTRDLWVHWLVYPGHSLPTAAAPVLVAMGLAFHDHVLALVPALLAFLASWLIHIAGLFTDNYELLTRHRHVAEHPELIKALDDGTITLRGLRRAITICLVLAALTGPYLLHVAGSPVILIGLLGIVGSLIYSAGPCPSGKFGLADPHFFLMFGVIAPAAAYYVQAAATQGHGPYWELLWRGMPANAWLVGLPLGALAVNILIIDDIRDRPFDQAKDWRTSPLRFGLTGSRVEYLAMCVVIYALPFWFWRGLGFSAWILLPLATLPFWVLIARRVCTRDGYDDLLPMTPAAAFLCLGYAVLLAAGLALS